MLKNVKFNQTPISNIELLFKNSPDYPDLLKYVNAMNEFYATIKPARKGFYFVGLNASRDTDDINHQKDYEGYHTYLRGERGKPSKKCWHSAWNNRHNRRFIPYSYYGTADTLGQIVEHVSKYVKSWPASDFVCLITPIKKCEQPEHGGWRYHKWGEYFGKRELKREYLYDDDEAPEIVFVFHIHELKK